MLGFDIGGTKCAVVLGYDDNGNKPTLIDKTSVPTDKPVYEMINSLFAIADEMLQRHKYGKDEITGIGISFRSSAESCVVRPGDVAFDPRRQIGLHRFRE